MNKPAKEEVSTSLGVFSPTGRVVMAFADDKSTEQAHQALLKGGFKPNDITRYSNGQALTLFGKNEEEAINPIQIGQDAAKVGEYLELAKEGSGFLVVHAPENEQAKLAVEIVRPFGLKFAEKYNRLTIEELA